MHSALPAASPGWCLFLDMDGALGELARAPARIAAGGAYRTLLGEVAARLGGAVALVSGRSIAYLDALVAPLRLPAAGLHGVERRKASGDVQGASYVDAQLNAARTALSLFVEAHPGTVLEDRDRSLALHYGLAPEPESSAREIIAAVAKAMGTNYQVQPGNQMLEIKPYGFTKGTATKEYNCEPPFSGRKPVFVGDDPSDTSGSRAVELFGGISVIVGDRIDGTRHAPDPAAVRRWLETIAALSEVHQA